MLTAILWSNSAYWSKWCSSNKNAQHIETLCFSLYQFNLF